jgi:hypothetical protein
LFALEPVFGGIAAWWWAGETLTWFALGGAGLILAGIILVETKAPDMQAGDTQPGGAGEHPLSGKPTVTAKEF